MIFVYILATLSISFAIAVMAPFVFSWITGGFFVSVLAGIFIKRRWLAVFVPVTWLLLLNILGNILSQIPIDLSKGWALIKISPWVIPGMIIAGLISYTLNYLEEEDSW